MLLVVPVLGGELEAQELVLLILVPVGDLQFVLSGARIDRVEEREIAVADWPEVDGFIHLAMTGMTVKASARLARKSTS